MRKALQSIHRTTDSHWVGDGFPVRTLLRAGKRATFTLAAGETTAAFVLDGQAGAEDNARVATAAELMLFARQGEEITLRAEFIR